MKRRIVLICVVLSVCLLATWAASPRAVSMQEKYERLEKTVKAQEARLQVAEAALKESFKLIERLVGTQESFSKIQSRLMETQKESSEIQNRFLDQQDQMLEIVGILKNSLTEPADPTGKK